MGRILALAALALLAAALLLVLRPWQRPGDPAVSPAPPPGGPAAAPALAPGPAGAPADVVVSSDGPRSGREPVPAEDAEDIGPPAANGARLDAGVELRGRVLDAEDRTPLPDAVVAFHPAGPYEGQIEEVAVDATGRFALTVPARDGRVTVHAYAPGHEIRAFRREVGDPRAGGVPELEMDLLLERSARVAGEVFDLLSGAPLEGVWVYSRLATYTDAEGRFDLPVQPDLRTGRIPLSLSKADYCPLKRHIPSSAMGDGEPLRLPMVPAARIEGRVTDADGRPIAGARIEVGSDTSLWDPDRRAATPLGDLPEGWHAQDGRPASERSAEGGRFRTRELLPWTERTLAVSAPGFRASRTPLPRLEPGANRRDIVLEALADVGTIVGTASWNGAPAASVRVRWEGTTRSGGSFVGEDGSYRIEDVEAGSVRVSVKPLSGAVDVRVFPGTRATVQVVAGAEVRHDFDVRFPVGTISGRVVQDDGRPAAGVHVWASDGIPAVGSTQTGVDGRYAVDVPDVGLLYDVSVAGSSDARRTDAPVGSTGVDLVVRSKARLRLSVVDAETARPVPWIEVVRRREAGDWHPLRGSEPRADGLWELELPAGFVELAVLADRLRGDARLRLAKPGYCELSGRLSPEDLAAGGPPSPLPLAPAAWIEGTVVDQEGRPVVGARVLDGSGAFYSDMAGSRCRGRTARPSKTCPRAGPS